MSEAPINDVWANANAYERYVGRWSRQVAREFLGWLGVERGLRWLDVGCGTGALSQTILDMADPVEVVGADLSAGFVAHARATVTDGRARFETGDARALPVEDDGFDVVVSGLAV